jgi:hypothetical protein
MLTTPTPTAMKKIATATNPKRKDKQTMTTKSELMSAAVKKYGIQRFCKSVEQGDVSVGEHELTALITEQAKRENTTFSKLFCAQDEQGITLRKAIAAARDAQFVSRVTTKAATLAPRVVGGADARAVNNPKAALAALQDLVDEQRRNNPTLSEAQAFSRVYEDPANASLVARERAENRPVASW